MNKLTIEDAVWVVAGFARQMGILKAYEVLDDIP
jgi:hypothetical protein